MGVLVALILCALGVATGGGHEENNALLDRIGNAFRFISLNAC